MLAKLGAEIAFGEAFNGKSFRRRDLTDGGVVFPSLSKMTRKVSLALWWRIWRVFFIRIPPPSLLADNAPYLIFKKGP
jgi:hypothetical protein